VPGLRDARLVAGGGEHVEALLRRGGHLGETAAVGVEVLGKLPGNFCAGLCGLSACLFRFETTARRRQRPEGLLNLKTSVLNLGGVNG
jgi:hypothetical protein